MHRLTPSLGLNQIPLSSVQVHIVSFMSRVKSL